MLTVDEALLAILEWVPRLPARVLPLGEALGLILDESIAADLDMPPFDKALMDGYAVRAIDLVRGETRLRVVEEITAGRVSARPLGIGEAAAIMTGAPLPPLADAVVMIEITRRDGEFVVIEDRNITVGRSVLARGREMRAGEIVLEVSQPLTPARLGLLASVGRAEVSVIPRPRVAIVPTGDELVDPATQPGPGQIRNSNATMLAALVRQSGAIAHILPIAPDEPRALAARLTEALEADLVLVTGGVSAGRLDLVPGVLESLDVKPVFHKVRVKPGKPIWFGVGPAASMTTRSGPVVFGLPGNPVSGLVGFSLFVRAALDALAGRRPLLDRTIEARLTQPFIQIGDRPTYHPARLVGGAGIEVEPLTWAGSADLRTVAAADGFAVFPEGGRTFEADEIVRFLPLE